MKLEHLSGLNEPPSAKIATIEVEGLASNSQDVRPGFVFFGLPGTVVDGSRFVGDAARSGAVAAVVSTTCDVQNEQIPILRSDNPRKVLAAAASMFFGDQPGIIGAVTGTAGKTSVATFLRQIWSHAGMQAASLGTTGVVSPGREEYGNLTTPDPISLHRLLAELAQGGVTHAAMEASSHGLDQNRLDGVEIAVAGFTNLGRDHLDYHADMQDYLAAKLRLFKTLLPEGAPAVIYSDDAYSQEVIEATRSAGRNVLTVGRQGNYLALKKVEHHQFNQIVELVHKDRHYRIEFPLAGDFQISNGLVAAGMALAAGTAPDVALDALQHLKGASGRLELVGRMPNHAPVYVDYAHKPEALENVLEALRPFTSGRIVLVFGCGGDRDPGKRPIMGEIAEARADIVIVTDDNPRSENPSDIRAQILATCPSAQEIGDRSQAIHAACGLMEKGDCLVIAGKGHEEGQIVGEQVLPFSDHKVALEAIKEMSG